MIVLERQISLGIPHTAVSISERMATRVRLDLRRKPVGARIMVNRKIMPDEALVTKMVAGDAAAFAALETRMQDCVWTACRVEMNFDDRLARRGFREVWSSLATTSFRKCGAWQGKGSFETFLTLLVREFVREWIAGLLKRDDPLGRDAFVARFDRVIKRCVAGFHREDADRKDAAQAVFADLLENNCARLKAYPGGGNFEAHVTVVVENLLRDDLRRIIGRRRLPAAIEKLSWLDQLVFKAIYWEETPADVDRLAAALGSHSRGATRADVKAALAKVHKALPGGYTATRPGGISTDAPTGSGGTVGDTLPGGDTPFDVLARRREEEIVADGSAALRRAIETLDSDEDRIYLQLFLEGIQNPRDIAKILGVSSEQVYVIKARAHRRMQTLLATDAEVLAWRTEAQESEGE